MNVKVKARINLTSKEISFDTYTQCHKYFQHDKLFQSKSASLHKQIPVIY